VLEPIAVGNAVGAALSLVNNRLQHLAAVQLELAETPPVRANAFGLTQVLVNLLLNAADAMESKGRERHAVTVSSRLDGDKVLVEVLDTGHGIPPADIPRLFEAGFTTKPVGKGNGIGLAVSRSIISSLGGSLEAGNRPRGGAAFRISLPVMEAPLVERAAPAPQNEPGRRKILVIDDEPNLAKTLALLLSAHDVSVCTNIAEAFDLCRRQHFDFVLCDLMMPNGGGMELHARFGVESPEMRARVVFMTGGTFTEAAAQFLADVPNRRLIKPFSPDELFAIVEGPI
jgi:CheY-like chemotaxis protein